MHGVFVPKAKTGTMPRVSRTLHLYPKQKALGHTPGNTRQPSISLVRVLAILSGGFVRALVLQAAALARIPAS